MNSLLRLLRGGSWYGGSWSSDPGDYRSAYRLLIGPGNAINSVGFRVVCNFTKPDSQGAPHGVAVP
jgi:formylglycine-generating enzyme required for sulfatase activity